MPFPFYQLPAQSSIGSIAPLRPLYYTYFMRNNLRESIKKPSVLLTLILLVFFLKGVFLATVYPMFTGQDEARHYDTIQYLAQPKGLNLHQNKRNATTNNDNFADYNFSQEILLSGQASGIDQIRGDIFDTVDFSRDYDGRNEAAINAPTWKPYNYFSPPDIATPGLYHQLAAVIEKVFASQNILVRFYSIRIFSVLLGTLAILFAYLIIENVGFPAEYALLLTAIVAFQPKLADYFTNINYDALLIPMFFLFTLGGVLALKNGLNWKNFLIMLLAAAAGMLTKGTGLILCGMLALVVLYFFHEYARRKNPGLLRPFYAFSVLIVVVLFAFFKQYLPLGGGSGAIETSLGKYLGKSLTLGHFALTSRTYWGSLGWVNSWTLSNFTDIIWVIEFIAAIGLIAYLFRKETPVWLPEKKYIWFLLAMVAALQLGIRAFDWKVFTGTGKLDLGTPGRYFLPSLVAHVILAATGLGTLLNLGKYDRYFKPLLALCFVLLFSLSFYLIFDVIVYRFYL